MYLNALPIYFGFDTYFVIRIFRRPPLNSLTNRLAVVLFAAIAVLPSASAATNPHVAVRPQSRIVEKIDNTKTVSLPYSHPARVASLADQGRVPANTQFNHMMLVLKSTDEQEFALRGLLDEQQDKSAANYHQWMTPETFGSAFGVASPDLAKVSAWLQDSGFSVEQITKGARIIEFSGTSGQVEAAFHTQMHQYSVNGELRVSNSTDISIPQAIAPVVMGISTLNNFRLKSQLTPMRHVAMGTDSQWHPTVPGTLSPDYTSASSGTHYIGGGDFSVLFDTKPLLAAGNNGAGQKIGILGQTDILLGDIQTYRSVFGLPPSTPNFVYVGNDPGTISDDIESDLDVEVSGAFAPGAQIDFYLSGNSYFGGGIDASGVYVVENNSDDIISLSYGECEADLGTYNQFFQVLWEQAASQGISVFVSSGDSGPDSCDDGASYAANGYSVSGLSSTPFNVSVGGTMFNEGSATGSTSYWGPAAGSPYITALGYIPEIPWNEGKFDIYSGGYGGIVAGSSGISIEYGTPSWQAGPGVPTSDPTPPVGTVKGFVVPGPHRYQPDVSLAAAGGHDGTLICSEGSCELDSNGNLLNAGVVGGTSIAAPSFAGVQALINQKNGGRQGLPNYYYYRAAAVQSTTNCNAATLPSAAGATCSFHDIQTGNNFVPSTSTGTISNGKYIGWNAGAGYDLAVGLGSPDVNSLATNWSSISFNATTTTFTLTPTTSSHGATLNTTITVNPVSGTGVPTGDISIIASAAYGAVGFYTLSSGSNTITSTLTGLPAGTYNVYAHYAGDVTYGGSNSAPIQVTISSGASSIVNNSYLLGANGSLTGPGVTTYTYGSNIYIDSTVCDPTGIANGGCATGTPTGTITYTLTNGSATLPVLVSPLDSFDDAYFDSGLGYSGYDIKPNYPTVAAPALLAPGTYTVNTAYSGDSTFNKSTGTPFTIVVGPANQALTLTTSTATVASAGPAILNASIATVAAAVGGVPATGTVTFTDTTTNTLLGTGTLTNGAVVFNTNKLVTAGGHSINAVYSGDTNYLTKTSSNVTIIVGGSATTTTLATTVGGTAATTAQVGQSVVLVASVASPATGTVYFYDGGVSLGTATLSTTTHTASRTVATFTAGTHTITATYAGNSTLDSSSSAVTTLTINKNTPTLNLTNQSANATGVGVAMNATLTPTPQNAAPMNPAPTNNIQFLDGTTVLGTSSIAYYPNFGTYVGNYTTQVLKPGTHTLSAQYLGDANYAGVTSNTQTINIGLTTLALAVSSSNVTGGAPLTLTGTVTPNVANTTPSTGTVTFYDGGTTVVGTATVTKGVATLVTGTPTLAPGVTHTITAVYSGDSNFYTSTSSAQTVVLGITSLALSSSSTNVGTGIVFTLTGTISPVSATPAPTGTVKFYDGTTLIGTATGPFAGGKATLSTSLASIGTHVISAVYSGDANYYTSSSTSSISITDVTPGFTVAVNPTSLTIVRGNTGTLTLSATSFGNYSGYGLMNISGLPANSSYIVTQSPIVFNGVNGTQNVTLYITTTAPPKSAGFFWIPAIFLAAFVWLRRRQMSAPLRQMMVFAIVLFGMMGMSGCGGSSPNPGTPTGVTTETITVTGTGTSAVDPNIAPTTTFTLTIQ